MRAFQRLAYACVIAANFVGLPAAAATQFSFKPIYIEHSKYVDATAINAAGTIVGTYVDSQTQANQGFVLAGRKLTKLPPFPDGMGGVTAAMPTAINAQGTVTGTYLHQIYNAVGWVWQKGAYVGGDTFLAGTDAGPVPILQNKSGEVAYNANYGFGSFAQFAGPPSGPLPVQGLATVQTTINSLNDRGVLAGTAPGVVRGAYLIAAFIGVSNDFTFIAPPKAVAVLGAFINDVGQVAGGYIDNSNVSRGFVHHAGKFNVFDFPAGAASVTVTAINNSGRVAGFFTDSLKNAKRLFFYNGTKASFFRAYAVSDSLNLVLSDNGNLLLSVTTVDSVASYVGSCSGTDC